MGVQRVRFTGRVDRYYLIDDCRVLEQLPRGLPVAATVFLVVCCLAVSLTAKEPKLTAEELVAHHLDSIAPANVRAAIKSRLIEGSGLLAIRLGGRGNLLGHATFLSEGRKVRFEMLFDHSEYNAEQLVFDAKKRHVGWIVPGSRSLLGQVAFDYGELLDEGLLGGVLSTAWPLLDLQARQPKLKYRGLKKVEGRKLHRLDYQKKRSANLKVSLYFEPETARHVLTTYKIRIPAAMGATPEASPGQRDTLIRLKETFSDFHDMDGLTLPAAWSIRVIIVSAQKSADWEWQITFETVRHNHPVEPNAFVLQ